MKEDFEIDVEEAVRCYADMVYRLALLNTRSLQDAEDVFQDVFLKLLRYQKTIQSEEHLKAWLIRVTLNQCKSKAMAVWTRKTVPLESVAQTVASEEKDDFSDVYDAVKNLPQKYRQVIYLYYYEGYKIQEIAQLLQKNESTVKTWLSRGKQTLNNMLKGGFEDDR